MRLGHFLKKLRTQKGLTIKEVVNQSDELLDKTTVSRIERDERGVSLRAAYALSKIYNIDIAELCEHALGKKIEVTQVPFGASDEERRLIENYRLLTIQRKRSTREIIRGLSMVHHTRSSSKARKQLKETLNEIELNEC